MTAAGRIQGAEPAAGIFIAFDHCQGKPAREPADHDPGNELSVSVAVPRLVLESIAVPVSRPKAHPGLRGKRRVGACSENVRSVQVGRVLDTKAAPRNRLR